MNLSKLGEALQLLAGKAPRATTRPVRPARPDASRSRPVQLEGCGVRGRAVLPLETELRLYHEMRRSFPILDTAITRLVRFCGCPRVEGPVAVQAELQAWMDAVLVVPAQRGLGSWLETHLDQMLVYGKAVGQVTLTPSRRDVRALSSLDPRLIQLEAGEDPAALRLFFRPSGCLETQELNPALTLLSLHAPQGNPHGTSLLRSLPFVTEACGIIENAAAQVWQRMGAPSFHVNWDGGDGFSDPQGTVAQGVTGDLEQSFTDMMTARRSGEVKDLFTAGKVSIGIIGSEGQVMAVQEPLRVFVEQMVAVTGLPPWLLGLHWSSTERLSVQQADLMVAHIEGLRREVQPQLEYLLELRQRLAGRARGGGFRLVWPPVNLRDATEQARADAWREQASQRRIENARRMWELGFWSQERAAHYADDTLTRIHQRLDAPPPAGLERTEPLGPIREDE